MNQVIWYDPDISKWRWDLELGGAAIHIAEDSLEEAMVALKAAWEPLGFGPWAGFVGTGPAQILP